MKVVGNGTARKNKKNKQQTLFTTKTIIKSIIKHNNQIYNKKNHNEDKLASDKNQLCDHVYINM